MHSSGVDKNGPNVSKIDRERHWTRTLVSAPFAVGNEPLPR